MAGTRLYFALITYTSGSLATSIPAFAAMLQSFTQPSVTGESFALPEAAAPEGSKEVKTAGSVPVIKREAGYISTSFLMPANIQPSVLIEDDVLKISTGHLTIDYAGNVVLKTSLENRTDIALEVDCSKMVVNGYAIDCFGSVTVAAGRTVPYAVTIPGE